jgi:DNA-binding response OmpR family regulator
MSRMDVLVVSSESEIGAWLAGRLSRDKFEVRAVRPGPALVEAVRERQPHLAVLDGIDAHPEAAQLAVALLKDRNPAVRIVALSGASSETDGEVIEQGIFCYLASCSRDELLRVIQAAVNAGDGRRRPRIQTEPRSI